MGKIRSVKYNFIMNVILTGSTFIFPLITFPYISRILLPSGVGKVNFATSVVSYFSMFAMLGIPTYGVRACAQVRDDREELSRTVHEILMINLAAGAMVYIAYFLALWTVPRLRADAALFYVMSATILFNVLGVEWMYKGLEQYSYITVRSIAFKFLAVCMMFLLVRDQDDYVIYGGISILAATGSNLLNFLNLGKYIELRPVGKYRWRRHWKPILVFFLMSVATTVYTNLDTVMLGFMKDDAEVGYYTAAVKIKSILVSFVTALSTVLLPRVSYYVEHDRKEEFVQVSRKALNFVCLSAFPVILYFFLYAEESILLLSGDSFGGAVLPMRIIMPTVLFIGITNILGIQIMVPLGKEKMVFYSVLAGAVVDLIINWLCIPSAGAAGAAFGTLIAELVVFVVQVILLKDQFWKFTQGIQFGKMGAAAVCGMLGGIWVKSLHMPVLSALLVSACVYFGIYGCLLLCMREKLLCSMIEQVWSTKIRKR